MNYGQGWRDLRAGKEPQMAEKDLQEAVERLAAMFGWRKFHTLRSEGSDEGFPDLVMIRRTAWGVEKPRLIVAELKREGENPTPGQRAWLEDFATIGAETYIWRPSDLELITRVLR